MLVRVYGIIQHMKLSTTLKLSGPVEGAQTQDSVVITSIDLDVELEFVFKSGSLTQQLDDKQLDFSVSQFLYCKIWEEVIIVPISFGGREDYINKYKLIACNCVYHLISLCVSYLYNPDTQQIPLYFNLQLLMGFSCEQRH